MSREPSEILSAFLDGEAVETTALADALAAPDSRELLVDFVLLRGAVAEAGDRPSADFYERIGRVVDQPAPVAPRRWLAAAAAAAVLLVAAIGITATWLGTDGAPTTTTPPVPVQTLHFERGVDWLGNG